MFGKIFGKRNNPVKPQLPVSLWQLEQFFDIQRTAKDLKIRVAPHEVMYQPEFVFLDAATNAMEKSGVANICDLDDEQLRDLKLVAIAVFYERSGNFTLADVTPADLAKLEQTRAQLRQMKIDRAAKYAPRNFQSVHAGGLKNWLEEQEENPELWHSILFGEFRDMDRNAYEWIVQQPRCDTATALMIFHLFNSFESLAYPDEVAAASHKRDREFRIAKIVCDRFNSGSFKSFKFAVCEMGYEASQDVYRQAVEDARQKFGAAGFVPADEFFVYSEDQSRRPSV